MKRQTDRQTRQIERERESQRREKRLQNNYGGSQVFFTGQVLKKKREKEKVEEEDME